MVMILKMPQVFNVWALVHHNPVNVSCTETTVCLYRHIGVILCMLHSDYTEFNYVD